MNPALGLAVLCLYVCLLPAPLPGQAPDASRRSQPLALSLAFEPAADGSFAARGPGYSLVVESAGIHVEAGGGARFSVEWIGATRAPLRPAAELASRTHYLFGGDRSQWKTNILNYAQVHMDGVYPGVDLVYYGNSDTALEHDFIIAPGRSPDVIRFRIHGAKTRLTKWGDLHIRVGKEELRFPRPDIYQEIEGKRVPVDGGFRRLRGGQYGFQVGAYDRSRPLVIDPFLVFSTYFGGPSGTSIYAAAADSSGNAYVGGVSYGGLPLLNQYSSGQAGFESLQQGFVAKFNAGGQLVYSTYIPGAKIYSIAADAAGNLYFAGQSSGSLPVTGGVVQSAPAGGSDWFVAKLAPTGSSLSYATYLGGSSTEFTDEPGLFRNLALAVDGGGNAYIAGLTASNNFPVVNGTGQVSNQGTPGGVVAAKLNPTATALVYSTYVGNTHGPVGGAAVDASGNLYITGTIVQTGEFVTTSGAYQPFKMGYDDAFVVKLSASGGITYATYLGGVSSSDVGLGITADASGNAYVLGFTNSTDFPAKNAYQSQCRGVLVCYDAFLTRLNPTGTDIDFSTYFGGTGNPFPGANPGGFDVGYAIASDASGIYIAGETKTPDFPLADAITSTCRRDSADNTCTLDAFVSKFSFSGSLLFSTYLGGTKEDSAYGVATDGNNGIVVAGMTDSTNFPRISAYQNSFPSPGTKSSFVARISTGAAAPALTANPEDVNFSAQIVNTTSASQGVTVTSSGNTATTITSITVSGDFLQSNSCPPTLNVGASCTVTVSFRPSATGARNGAVTISSSAGVKTITLSGTGQSPPDITLAPTGLTFGSVSSGQSSAPQGVTLTNNSGTPLTITSITSGNSDYQVNHNCGVSLAASASCSINVTFTPVGGGTRPGTVTLQSNAAGSPHVVTLTGTGLAPGAGIFPLALAFGTVQVGDSSATQQVVVTSNGSQPLVISSVGFTGTNTASFARTTNCVATLNPGASCVVDVVFAPSVRGANTAALVFAANTPLASVTLSGTGLGPALSFNPVALSFTATTVGNTSAEQSSVLTNSGDVPVAIDTVGLQFGIDFRLRDDCPVALNPAQSCTVYVKFAPRALGGTTKSNTVQVVSSTPGLTSLQKQMGLSGTATIPNVSVAPLSVDFGTRPSGESASAQLVVVNLSGTTITFGTKIFTGTNPSAFALGTDGCASLNVNSNNCATNVTFNASGADGARTATFNLPYTGTTGSPLTVSLTGQVGSTPYFTFANPASADPANSMLFATTNQFSVSVAQTLTITNSGNVTANISSIQVSGQYAYSTTCGATLAAGANCTLTVNFAPVTGLAGNGRIRISSDAAGSPHVIGLFASTGNPTPIIDSLSPATVTAGATGFNLIVNGSRFINGATVRVNGNNRVTAYLSPNQLVATLQTSDLANAGNVPITVFHTTPGGGLSGAVNLVVQANAAPVGAVETALGASTGTASLPQFGNLTVTGWAADPEDGAPVSQVRVQVLPPGVTNVSGIYIADTTNNRIRRVDSFGNITTVAGTGTSGNSGDNNLAINAQFNLALVTSGVTVAPNGDFYISDANSDRIRKVTASSGNISTIAGGGGAINDGGLATAAALLNPVNTAVAANGDVYIVGGQSVRKIAAGTGIITTVAGDSNTGVASFSGDGGQATAARLALPQAIAFDSAGNLYIADSGNNRVRRVDKTTGVITTVVGNGNQTFNGDGLSPTATNIYGPYGIAFDAQDNLYMASIGQDRIRRYSPGTNTVTTVAGSGSRGFAGDGAAATAAALNLPRGVALDSEGHLYIGDNMNHRIRRVDKNTGIITTVAGTGTAGGAGDNGAATSATLNQPAWVGVNGAASAAGGVNSTATLGGARPDVANAQSNGAYLNSGWSSTFNVGLIAPGTYKVRAVATDSHGLGSVLGPEKTITVTQGNYALVRTASSAVNGGAAVVGRRAVTQTNVITNDGNSPLTVSSVSSSSTEFEVSTNCSGISAGSTCGVFVTFMPSAAGPRNATITIHSNDPTGQKTFTVSGTGVNITMSLSRPQRTPRAGTPAPGAARDEQFLAMIHATGVSEVDLSCDTRRRDYTCSVTPGRLDLAAGNVAMVTLSSLRRSARLKASPRPQVIYMTVTVGELREVLVLTL